MKKRTQPTTSVETVRSWLERANETLPGFEGFEAGERILVTLHPEKLPVFEELRDVELQNLIVSGELAPAAESFEGLRRILRAGQEIGRDGHLAVHVELEEEGSEQTKARPDKLSLFRGHGKWGFGFCGEGAKAKDAAACRDLVRRVVEAGKLPLRLVGGEENGETGHFRLEHVTGGWLHASDHQRPPEGNPASFQCHFSEDSPDSDELVDRMAEVARAVGSGKIFAVSWKAQPIPIPSAKAPEASRKIYETVAGAPETFRTERFGIEGELRLLDLSGLETLRPMCHGKDRILTALGYTRNFEGEAVNFEVETRAEGHRLVVESRGGFDVHALEEELGLEFV